MVLTNAKMPYPDNETAEFIKEMSDEQIDETLNTYLDPGDVTTIIQKYPLGDEGGGYRALFRAYTTPPE